MLERRVLLSAAPQTFGELFNAGADGSGWSNGSDGSLDLARGPSTNGWSGREGFRALFHTFAGNPGGAFVVDSQTQWTIGPWGKPHGLNLDGSAAVIASFDASLAGANFGRNASALISLTTSDSSGYWLSIQRKEFGGSNDDFEVILRKLPTANAQYGSGSSIDTTGMVQIGATRTSSRAITAST